MFYFRVKSTGKVLGAGHSSAQGSEWIARYASALGEDPDDIEQFESDIDPRPVDPRTEPDPDPVPDPNGFLAAGRDEYGAAFWLTIPFPGVAFILEALNKGDWPSVRLGMDAMLQAKVITSAQHERLHELLDEHGIPPLVAEE